MTVQQQRTLFRLTGPGMALLVVLACALVPGCSRESGDTDEVVDPGPTPEELAEQRKAEIDKRLQANINRVKTLVGRNRKDFTGNLKRLQGVLQDARGTRHEKTVQGLIDDEKKRYQKQAQDELDAAIAKAEEANADNDHRAAIDALETWDAREYGEMPMHATWKQHMAKARLYEKASQDIGVILDSARSYRDQQDVAIAIAYLESYPDRYKDTTYYAEVRALIDEYYEEYQSVKAEKEAVLDVPWIDDEIDEHLTAFSARAKDGADVWKGSGDGIASGDNSTDAEAHLLGGADEWLEYILEFEVKVGDDQEKLEMGIHKNFDFKTKQMQFMSHAIPLEGDKWYKLRIEVAEGQIKVSDEDDPELYTSHSGRMGGYAFRLRPGEKIWIRNFRHKVLQAAEKEPEDDDS